MDPISSELVEEKEHCLTSLLDLRSGCAHRLNGPDRLVLTSAFPLEFFADLRCPPVLVAIKVMVIEVHHGEGLHMGQ